MSKITIWTCDKCGKTAEAAEGRPTPSGLYNIGLLVSEVTRYGTVTSAARISALWCLGCCEAMNIGPLKARKVDEPPPVLPNLEDLINEMIDEAVNNAINP